MMDCSSSLLNLAHDRGQETLSRSDVSNNGNDLTSVELYCQVGDVRMLEVSIPFKFGILYVENEIGVRVWRREALLRGVNLWEFAVLFQA